MTIKTELQLQKDGYFKEIKLKKKVKMNGLKISTFKKNSSYKIVGVSCT